MKVTVCFEKTKIIVPCGDGELTISELIKRAVNRYCKASFIDNIQDIKVQCLQTEEQAILDIDDLVSDVCDDKDKLIAVYDDRNKKTLDDHSTDYDNNNIRNTQSVQYTHQHEDEITPYTTSTLSDNDSGVAADSYGISSNPTSTHTSFNSSSRPPRGIQRRFQQNKNASFRSSASSNSPNSSPESTRKLPKAAPFSRNLNRKSLSTNHPMLYSWIDQHDRFNSSRFFQDNSHEEEMEENEDQASQHSSENEIVQLDRHASKTVDVKPYTTSSGKEIGLVVYDVEEGSYVDRVGELQTADRITEINGIDVTTLTNTQAMDMYNDALKDDVIKLKRARSHSFLKDDLTLQKSTKGLLGTDVTDKVIKASKEAPRPVPKITSNETSREAAIEVPNTSQITTNSPDNKRHVFTIDLLKDKDGLGFTVTSKDVLTSKECTFYIKNILGKGAAIKDGRLKAGDQLLAINDTVIKSQGQSDVVKILRGAQGIVTLKLSRDKSEMTEDEIVSLQENSELRSRKTSSRSDVVPAKDLTSSPLREEILKLTIPLTSAGAESLGITVKGKRSGDSDSDDGIYVNSIMNGGSAAKDGRLLSNDRLICINDTSLVGLSNRDAMSVLRALLEKSKEKGTIQIIVGRQKSRFLASRYSSGTSSPIPSANPVRGEQAGSFSRTSPAVNRKAFQRPESPSIDCRGRRTPERFSPRLEMRRKVSIEKRDASKEQEKVTETDKEFEERYLQRGLTANHYAIGRNKSYFRAVNSKPTTEDPDPNDNPETRRTVSVSSTEMPTVQRSVSVYIEQEGDLRNSKRGVKKMLPSYEEALRRKNSGSSTHSSTKTDSRNNSFKVLPDKYFAISKEPKPVAEKTLSLESNLPEQYILPAGEDLHKQISLQKSLSLDSINKGLDGNLSDHEIFRCNTLASQSSLDSILATSYQFSRDGFGRLSISEKKGRGQIDAKQSQFYNKLKKCKSMGELRPSNSNEMLVSDGTNKLKRTESIDTLICKIDAEEQKQAFKRNDVLSSSTPWGNPSPKLNGYTDRQRHRNSDFLPLSNVDDKKKKTGIFNTLSGLLKKNKKKDGKTVLSPEAFDYPKIYNGEIMNDVSRRTKNSNNQERPQSLGPKFLQADLLQKELVQAKIEELKKSKSGGIKKRKSDNEINRIDWSSSPSKEEHRTYKSGYNTWNVHDANNMREKSKQFFMNNTAPKVEKEQVHNEQRPRIPSLQRQSSLPPRTKKENLEIHRVLPRAPSGPMYKSPEQKHRTTKIPDTPHHIRSSSTPNSKSTTPIRNVRQTNSGRTPNSRLRKPVEDNEKRYSSISDLTKRSSSVKISHTAEI